MDHAPEFDTFGGAGDIPSREKSESADSTLLGLVASAAAFEIRVEIWTSARIYTAAPSFFGPASWNGDARDRRRAALDREGPGGVLDGTSLAMCIPRDRAGVMRLLHKKGQRVPYVMASFWRRTPRLLHAKLMLKDAMVLTDGEVRDYSLYGIVYRAGQWLVPPSSGL